MRDERGRDERGRDERGRDERVSVDKKEGSVSLPEVRGAEGIDTSSYVCPAELSAFLLSNVLS